MNAKPSMADPGGEQVGILVVDDEPFILNSVKRTLRKLPWTVHTAPGGEEGLEILARERIQVVISDYQMAGMDGVAFLNRSEVMAGQ